MDFCDLPRGLPNTPHSSGDASRQIWMPPETISNSDFWTYSPNKIFLGQTESGQDIGFLDDRHILTVAGSRAGKGQAAILPNLALYQGSVMVLDPKGENAADTAERRGLGRGIADGGIKQDVYVLDPFKVSGVSEEYLAGFNPISTLDPSDPFFVDDCDSIADALIVSDPNSKDDHWNSSARLVLRGFIAWVAASPQVARRDLIEVYRLLHLPPDIKDTKGLDSLLADMLFAPEVAHGIPSDAAAALLGMGANEMGSVLSTVRQNILFLSSPPMIAMLSNNERSPDLKAWKMGGMSIYLCLPATRLHRHSRFFRLFVNRLLSAIESTREKADIPALMILDEMHVLGRMASLETAAGLIAGYGVRIWTIWQDFAQLKSLYADRWETFLGNASVIQSFGLNDLTTLKYMSEKLGSSSILSINQNEQSIQQAATGFSGQSHSVQASPLLSPEEIAEHFSRQSGNQLINYTGAAPIHLKRVPYYSPYFDNVRDSNG